MKKNKTSTGVPISVIGLGLGMFSCWIAYEVLRYTNEPWHAFYTLCGCLLVFAFVLDKMENEGD